MKIALLGDIALFGKNTVSNSNYKSNFSYVRNILESCDYVVGNLETLLTYLDETIGGKSAYIKGSPEDVELLRYLHVTHVSLANNHMFDYKLDGLEDTIKVLESNGIEWYGAKNKRVTISNNDGNVALLGYCCYSTNGRGMRIINPFEPEIIEKELGSISEGTTILSIHWGQEHVHYPNYDHIEVARRLCNKYPLIIHGHHPHVIQGIEEVGESIIAYSLGNFCFDDVYTNKSDQPLIKLSDDNQETFILILEIKDSIVRGYQVVPVSFVAQTYTRDNSILKKILPERLEIRQQ